MNKPSEKPNDILSAESKKRIKAELWDQLPLVYNRFESATNKYIQHVFIVNAGGSAAVLAFLGAKAGSSFAILPLLFFAAGVIACGINLLASFYINKVMFDDALNRYRESKKEDIRLEDVLPKAEKIKKSIWYRIAEWTSFFAHGCFIVGVIVGGVAYLNSANTK